MFAHTPLCATVARKDVIEDDRRCLVAGAFTGRCPYGLRQVCSRSAAGDLDGYSMFGFLMVSSTDTTTRCSLPGFS